MVPSPGLEASSRASSVWELALSCKFGASSASALRQLPSHSLPQCLKRLAAGHTGSSVGRLVSSSAQAWLSSTVHDNSCQITSSFGISGHDVVAQ